MSEKRELLGSTVLGARCSRRLLLRGAFAAALAPSLGALLAACGGEAAPTPAAPAPAASPTPPAATPTPAAASPTVAATPTGQAGGEPVRLGVLLPYSGVYTALGENITRGLELYLEEIGYQAGGRTIEVYKEDDAANPEVGLTKARQLVERDGVHLLAGIVHSGVATALRDFVDSQQIPLIIANAGAAALTRDPAQRSPYIFRVSFANGQYEWPLGPYAHDSLGYARVAVTAPDYSAGHEKANAFKAAFQKAGGQIVDEVYPPLDTADFGPFLQRLQQAQVDAVWAFFAGADAVRFVQQYNDFGLKDQFPLIGAGDLVDEAYLEQQGEAALDAVTSLHYTPQYDSSENQAFVQAFRGKHGQVPNQFAYQGYLCARVIAEALDAVEGQVEEREAFLSALKQVQFTGPTGQFRFHPETQNVVFTVFFRRVERLDDGSLGNVVLDKVEGIDDLSF
ncbi:ABC transporter substrate-binding protein [Thermomicrobiaceae bacterium CFH 74404]|uniref:ABC transporter substrate-binding protein n=1 Tax=Thermalbibacter longus TaxID=2951981 RepID=A0AA41WD51_9BACT|nr:ABC transporter substrate-binding protein [Thermalbibacter longus]MCM8747830.1 ABC transporter substrate-binding protein [Thermalbibacter longus]